MPTSEARILANRRNSELSTGPKTEIGKMRARMNSRTHGMTATSVTVPEDEAVEIDRRHQALTAELAPGSESGSILVEQMAMLSVRMERCGRRETAAVAKRVRHAATNHDAELVDAAEVLIKTLGEDPRVRLRALKRFPEGVVALVEAWTDLRAGLVLTSDRGWDLGRWAKMANLLGREPGDPVLARLEALSQAVLGDFSELAPEEGSGLDAKGRRAWARTPLVERVDAEIAALERHFETLDHEAFDRDRSEAADRALFEDSREASLARRYESEARRGFFKSLDRFHAVEAEVEARKPVEPLSYDPDYGKTPPPLASFRESAVEPAEMSIELAPPPLWPPSASYSMPSNVVRTGDGEVLAIGKGGRGSTPPA
jgi:hypothetical protein